MDNLKNNKKTIFYCILILLFVLGIYYFNELSKRNNSEGILENRDKEIVRYDANQYVPVYMTDEDMVKKYLIDFKNLMLNDVEEAYDTLNSEYRNLKYNSIDEFIQYVNTSKSLSLYTLNVKKYSIKNINGYKYFDIYGTDGNRYIIKEISIMNYEVFLDNYTVEIK